jgi:hypothetical protein
MFETESKGWITRMAQAEPERAKSRRYASPKAEQSPDVVKRGPHSSNVALIGLPKPSAPEGVGLG